MGSLILTLFTNDPELARRADQAGVDRVGPDLEILGKRERQGHLNTRISAHTIEDFVRVASVLKHSERFARVNPINQQSELEIESLLELGANVLMLPMFHSVDEVSEFVRIVRGRAKVVLLVETKGATLQLNEILSVRGIDEIHFGLNDLQIALGTHNQLDLLKSDLMTTLCATVRRAGIPYGIGGVARVGASDLPYSWDLFYAEYARLGSTGAILSRSFLTGIGDLRLEIEKARSYYQELIC